MLKPSDLPAPETLIEYFDGQFGPLMFHYMTEGHDMRDVAAECGFDTSFISMEGDLADDEHPLMVEHFKDGQNTALAKWTPTDLGDDWKLVAKYDTEEGPMACFIRPHAKT